MYIQKSSCQKFILPWIFLYDWPVYMWCIFIFSYALGKALAHTHFIFQEYRTHEDVETKTVWGRWQRLYLVAFFLFVSFVSQKVHLHSTSKYEIVRGSLPCLHNKYIRIVGDRKIDRSGAVQHPAYGSVLHSLCGVESIDNGFVSVYIRRVYGLFFFVPLFLSVLSPVLLSAFSGEACENSVSTAAWNA